MFLVSRRPRSAVRSATQHQASPTFSFFVFLLNTNSLVDMRFDVPLVSTLLCGATALAAAVPRADRRDLASDVLALENEVKSLEQQLQAEIASLQSLAGWW